ncbi:MAG: MarC family protein [Candidatus Woesearchaeota archaeon]
MIPQVIQFLVMLNPFALFLYLLPVMRDLDSKTFYKVLAKASFISLVILGLCVFLCNLLIENVFQINLESARIFGGIIIFSFAYYFIIKGEQAYIYMKGSLDDLASEIALPFMVGAGTITLSLFLGQNHSDVKGFFVILIALIITFVVIMVLKEIRDFIFRKRYRIAFDKNMELLLRLNGFFIGAIGINMVRMGVVNLLQ